MGSCVSLNRRDSNSPPTVKIVSVNGDLREYNVPVLASQVLEAESAASSSSSYFICDSDSLLYDDFIPAVKSAEPLHAEQIYFVLPISKRRNRLTAPDMAALAVKASVAIQNSVGKDFRRRKKGRISPIMTLTTQPNGSVAAVNGKASESTDSKGRPLVKRTATYKASSGYNRSGSVRNLRRHTSRRAKLAVRSFRLKLSTIHEGSVV
ncbi:hypothetical protein Bca4012_094422 [Brassica carinata]|uniref:Poly polymerase n=2 Tax=Brassica TaxID=3705 RepID=A0A8X7PSK8_BRACI|nr:uncharacterized protein LOC111212075 [Brassica napus]KAG2257246.1 hypothetical protein Bca52824_076540 [Brassica carinata]CAF2109778.1 unnamed protein product [Brassica napus]CDY33663.1 BnaC08g19630D [Brassica napus]